MRRNLIRVTVGVRTEPSSFRSSLKVLCSFQSLRTVGWYLLSAFCFIETYLWSASSGANLALRAETK